MISVLSVEIKIVMVSKVLQITVNGPNILVEMIIELLLLLILEFIENKGKV